MERGPGVPSVDIVVVRRWSVWARSRRPSFALFTILTVVCSSASTVGVAGEDRIQHTPRSKREIEETIAALLASETDGEFGRDAKAAVRLLNVYRYLAGLGHDVRLDADYTRKAQAACDLFSVTGVVTHDPENPGWPLVRFEIARVGAQSSSLGPSNGSRSLTGLVRSTLHDTDSHRDWEFEHRRWCLNPSMGRTGFGSSSAAVAMWAIDCSGGQEGLPAVFAWPPPGYVPVRYLRNEGRERSPPAWSVHLDPSEYAFPTEGTPTVRVWELRRRPPDRPSEFERWLLRLREREPVGIRRVIRLKQATTPPGLAWALRRDGVSKGDRFWVEIPGLVHPDTGEARAVSYYVEGF